MGAQDKKFKVGDRVRRVEPSDWPEQYGEVGKEYTVLRVSPGDSIEIIPGESGAAAYAFELVEPQWQPKVGDRVRYKTTTPAYGARYSSCGLTIRSINAANDDGSIDIDVRYDDSAVDYDQYCVLADLEPLPVAAEAQPLRIVAGGYYKTRDGRKVGPMKLSDGIAEARGDFGWVCVYTDTLRANLSGEHRDDIIAEWVDEPAVAVAASNDNAAPAIDKGTLVKTKNGYGFELARIGDYAWVDVGQKAPITVLISNIQAA